MSDLLEFLRARLDEDHWTAQGAARTSGAEWTALGLQSAYDARMDDHIAHFDPARMMAEVEAKRRIMDEHRHGPPSEDGAADDVSFGCYTCRVGRDGWMWIDGWCPTLRLLALPYADHEDYDEAWRP